MSEKEQHEAWAYLNLTLLCYSIDSLPKHAYLPDYYLHKKENRLNKQIHKSFMKMTDC